MGQTNTAEATSTKSAKAEKITSIQQKFLRRVLPVALVPLLVLSALTVGVIFFLNDEATSAVNSAEGALSERIGESAARSSERAARELAEYVDQWAFRTDRLVNAGSFRQTLANVSNATADASVDPASPDFQADLTGPLTRPTQILALTLREELATFEMEENLQILLVSEQGYTIGATDSESPLDHSQSEWFIEARDSGVSARSFVNDGDGAEAFELAFWTEPPATTPGGGVIRIRVAMHNVQWLLDEIALDDAVSVSLVDNQRSVLLADTETSHAAEFLFDESQLLAEGSGFNAELLTEGDFQDDASVTSANSVSVLMDNDGGISFDWLTQASQPIEAANSSLTEIREVSENVTRLRSLLLAGVLGILIAASFIAVIAVQSAAKQITRPVKLLSDQAQAAAGEGIPAVVDAARMSEDLPELPEFDVDTNDELAILATSLNTMQDAAVDLAAGQAKLRRQNVARTFVSLGRRNQNLLNRQLEFITELEQQERDPDQLENLFRLDHLATRMRRNAENLLVLAGEQTPRRWGRPIAVRDVIRAAASEIADYPRVRLGEIDAATVSGSLATDLSHLIAELLENAGSFSPPNTPIEVLGQHTSTHYRLAIVDQGIGMDPQALSQVNDRLQNPVDFADAPSAYLGLFVVGRLAQEMGITVRLASADPTGEGRRRGTIAFIDLPVALLTQQSATPIELEKGQEGAAHRAEALDAAQAAAPEPAPVLEPAPAVQTPEPVLAEAEPAPALPATEAGFPKRRAGATSIATEPASFTPSKPAEMPAEAVPATQITSAGFPKRQSAETAPPTPQPAPAAAAAQSGPAPKRDAAQVSDSLRSIRAAVARGRASGQIDAKPGASAPQPQAGAPVAPVAAPVQPAPIQPASVAAPVQPTQIPVPAPDAPVGVPAQASMPAPAVTAPGANGSSNPPPVPITGVAPGTPTAESGPAPHPEQPPSNQQPTPGSE